MAEYPAFMAENLFALMAMTSSDAGITGCAKENVLDNLHYTRWEPAAFTFSTTIEINQCGLSESATYQGGAPTRGNYFGEANDGVNFNGSSQYLNLTSKDIGYVHTLECTVDSTIAAARTIIGKDHGASKYSIFGFDGTNIIYTCNDGAANYTVTQAHGGLSSGSPHRFWAARNGRFLQFYKNGAPLGAQKDLGSGAATAAFQFDIIAGVVGASTYWTGKLAKIRAYNYAATDTEISTQWANGGIVSKPIFRLGFGAHALYEMNGAKEYSFTFDPVAAVSFDTVIVNTIMNDPHGHIHLTVNGTRYCWSIDDVLQRGLSNYETSTTKIVFQSGMTINVGQTAVLKIYAASTPKVRHIWGGLLLSTKNPVAPFDPEKKEDVGQQFAGRSGVIVKNTPIYTKRILDMTLNNINAVDAVNLQTLYDKSKKKKLPFWYFFRPTTNPRGGYLYEFDEDGWDMPYTEGQYRSLHITAKANFTPDRSSATL